MSKGPILKYLQHAFHRNQWLDNNPQFKSDLRGLSRREFLMASAALGLGVLPTACTKAVSRFGGSGRASSDSVIILGGGIAGLTAAYRLMKAGQASVIFEGSNRFGGRVQSKFNFNDEGMSCELGAELIDTDHHELQALAAELGVDIVNFGDDYGDIDEFVFHFGLRHYYQQDLLGGIKPLAEVLEKDIALIFPDTTKPQLDYRNHTPRASELDRISLSEYLDSHRHRVDKWIIDLVRVGYTAEFGLDPEEQSALNLLAMVDPGRAGEFHLFGSSDETMRVRGGNSKLIQALEAAIEGHVPRFLGHRLVKMQGLGSELKLTFDTGAAATQIAASTHVLCTLPFSTLRDVEGIENVFSPVKLRCVRELGYGANAKNIIGFRERRWKQTGHKYRPNCGYAFTALPSQNFWDSSRGQSGRSGILTNFLGGSHQGSRIPSVNSALNDLDSLYPGLRSTFDGRSLSIEWKKMPLSKGSYACPMVGQCTALLGSQGEAEVGGKLLFAGEHVSVTSQGYMNGAIETALTAVQRILQSN